MHFENLNCILKAKFQFLMVRIIFEEFRILSQSYILFLKVLNHDGNIEIILQVYY